MGFGDFLDPNAETRDLAREIDRATEDTLRGAWQSDPLMNLILGSYSKYQGQPFNADEVYNQGAAQIEKVRQRRGFDAMRQLAQFGFGGDQSQMGYAGQMLDQSQNYQNAALREMVDMAAIQNRPERLASGFTQFTNMLGQNLGTGAQLGILGNRSKRSTLSALAQGLWGNRPGNPGGVSGAWWENPQAAQQYPGQMNGM